MAVLTQDRHSIDYIVRQVGTENQEFRPSLALLR